MPQATGAKTRLIGVTEDVYNVLPASPDAELLYAVSHTIKPSAARENDPTLSGYRGQQRGTLGRVEVAGAVTVSLAAQSIGFWLKHLIGAPVTTGAGPYEHLFQLSDPDAPSSLPPGISFEVDYGAAIVGAGRYVRYHGCRINQGRFQFQTQGTPSATFDIVGARADATATASFDPTPTDPGHAAWAVADMSLVIDGGTTLACLESLDMTWNNDLDTDLFCINNGGQRHDLPEGFAIVNGSFVSQFDTPALLNKALSDEDIALQITLKRGTGVGSAGNESLEWHIPLSTLDQTAPEVTGPKGLKAPFNFVAHRAAGAELAVTCTLKNQRATI